MKEFVLLLLFIVLLTGLQHSRLYGSYITNIVVGVLYSVGFLGLYTIYKSINHKNKKKQWNVLLAGLLVLLIAHFILLTLSGR